MLGDHSDWAKSKPWEGSAHVPLACTGPPHLVRPSRLVTMPVTTMDLAATWLDFAQVPVERSGMIGVTSTSLRGVLNGSAEANRQFIASGLGRNASGVGEQTWNWRMIVKRVTTPPAIARNGSSTTALLKYICCESTCPGNPSNVPSVPAGAFQELLYNVDTDQDWAEMKPLPLSAGSPWLPEAVAMRAELPPAFAAGCQHAVKPPPPGSTFHLLHGQGCVTRTADIPHAPVTLDGTSSKCAAWTTSRTYVGQPSGDVIMIKHSDVVDPCAPNASASTIEIGPPTAKGFVFADGTLTSAYCPGMCLGVTAGPTLASVACGDSSAKGFKLEPL